MIDADIVSMKRISEGRVDDDDDDDDDDEDGGRNGSDDEALLLTACNRAVIAVKLMIIVPVYGNVTRELRRKIIVLPALSLLG